ncbi:MAG: DUF2461 domain-containing protein [Bacteroidetes bacterium]|nr:DUF2461 domain-containing protein [Bacteroidota bacterium]
MENPYITQALFAFLRELKANNNRDWFHANKNRYVDEVRQPLLDMIEEFAPHLNAISPHYLAIPKASGGSLFRIYRDTRFSKIKLPYKTHAGIQFRHEAGKDAHAPGFYLHLEPGGVFVGMGVWHPETSVLTAIRQAIVDDPERWKRTISEPGFSEAFVLGGDRLKRPPKGFDADHTLIEDLKRKDYFGVCLLSEDDALAPDFLTHLAEIWDRSRGFMQFLTEAMGLPF